MAVSPVAADLVELAAAYVRGEFDGDVEEMVTALCEAAHVYHAISETATPARRELARGALVLAALRVGRAVAPAKKPLKSRARRSK